MKRNGAGWAGLIFTAPAFADPDRNLAARQIFTIVRAFILSSVFLQFVQLAVAPRITASWLTLLLATLAVSLVLQELNRRGHVRLAAYLLVLSLWLLIGIFAWTASGLGARAAWGYFIVVFIAGMILGRWLAIIVAAICSASTLLIALAAPVLSPDPVKFWLINTLYLVIVLLLQELAGSSIRDSLARAHSEQHERQLAESELRKSEERFRIMFESGPIGIASVDASFRFGMANQAFCAMVGYSEDELRRRRFLDLTHPDHAGSDRESLRRLQAGEIPFYRTEKRYLKKGGGVVWGAVTVSAIRGSDGQFLHFLVMIEDITMRMQAEKEREQVISLLQATLESTADGILVIDSSGKIANYNQRFAQLWQIPEAVLAARDDNQALDFVLGQLVDPQGFMNKVRELYDSPRLESFDLLEFKDGRCFERYSRPQWIAGQPRGRVWSFRDISERKRAEEQRQRSEGLFRSIFEASPIGIELYGAEGTQINANRASLEMFGIDFPEDLSSFNIFDGTSLSAENKERLRRGETVAYLAAFDFDKVRALKLYRTKRSGVAQMDFIITPLLGGGADGILGYLLQVRDVTERIRSEAALKESEYRYRMLFEASSDSIFVMKGDHFFDCNSKTLEMFRCTREQIVGASPVRFSPPLQPDGRRSRDKAREKIGAAYAGQPQFFEWSHLRADDTPFLAEVSLTRIDLAADVFLLALVRDVSERRKLEEQLLQAQKMEAIGNLAGGVAHDFNNILSTIVGYGSLLQMKLPPEGPQKEYVERILAASERAANLTGSLLTFSRKQEAELQPVDLNDAIFSFHKVLARLIGEDIDLSLELASESLVVAADPRQIEQVLMNLVNNSREAMPRGGRLTITTAVVSPGDSTGAPAGEFAAVSVADTGVGIRQEIQDRVFEPFFTTKEVGRGTGLGLAIAYGIIQKHNGFIAIASSPGLGSKVTVYLPLKTTPVEAAPRQKEEPIPTGSETILLVEDDPAVRQVTRSVLEEYGYTVLEADDGVSAQYVFREHSRRIDLVVCDLLMPRLNGRETLAGLRKVKAGIPAIFISGYASDVIAQKGLADSGAQLLMKPLNPGMLLRQVRALLDRQRAAPGRDAEATAVPAGGLTKKQSRR